MRQSLTLLAVLIVLTCPPAGAGEDVLSDLTETFAAADCCRFEFYSILHSEVFDSVDSTLGSACIAADGRYRIRIGEDQYLYDGDLLYSYSAPNEQVTVERPAPQDAHSAEVSFITRLDEYYRIEALRKDHEYRLYRADSLQTGLPDSMTVWVGETPQRLDRIEYYDLNDDLTVIEFLTQQTFPVCPPDSLVADFPNSTEIIKLY